jgi:uncharacterized protein with ParB-like and HNH nuclease domain
MRQALIQETVRTEVLTLQSITEKQVSFVIPSYQRPYVWKTEDVLKLLDDIKNAFIAKEQHYFIGSSLSAVHNENNRFVYELIDGQQRITTLMLISIAFKGIKLNSPLAKVAVLDKQPRLSFAIRDSVRNLLGSYAGLEHLSKPGADAIEHDPYLKHLYANLEVLTQAIATFDQNNQFDITAFADYLYQNVCWVNNIVPDKLDLNRLFASMNTAGVQLEPADLLKAKLFKLITTEKSLFNKIWLACEHTQNYFERNLRHLFPNADWNQLTFDDLSDYAAAFNSTSSDPEQANQNSSKTLAELYSEVKAGDHPQNPETPKEADDDADIEDATVYCRSVISFDLLLIHTLRIFCANQNWPDLIPRIKAANLLACFSCLLAQNERTVKDFLLLLWQVRYQFDKWVVKWVEHDDAEDPLLRLTSLSRSNSNGKFYINRKAKDASDLAQLQAVLNFTGDRSAHYWLTVLLAELVKKPRLEETEVLSALEHIDNQLSLTTQTQKEASFQLAKGGQPTLNSWQRMADYFATAKGTGFEHYWFQKLEYLLWKHGDGNDEKLKKYRITSKNSVEHVHPQHEEYQNNLPTVLLDAFGNLVLLSPGENSSYSNQAVAKKKADFDSKPRYDSLKLKALFETYETLSNRWGEAGIKQHQAQMLALIESHYQPHYKQ